MDTEDLRLINDIQAKSEERIIGHINGTAKGVRAKIESEVNRIDELDKIRNSRIEKAENNITILKKETRISRWAHRNPRIALVAFVILVAGVATGLHTINVKRTIEKVMKIEFNEAH